jgi:hypothetical protein
LKQNNFEGERALFRLRECVCEREKERVKKRETWQTSSARSCELRPCLVWKRVCERERERVRVKERDSEKERPWGIVWFGPASCDLEELMRALFVWKRVRKKA